MSENLRECEINFSNYRQAESKFLNPFQRKKLLKKLHGNLPTMYRRRIEIMLLADIGKSQAEICRILGCSRKMARDWITVVQTEMTHKLPNSPIGRPKTVSSEYIEHLKELVSHSPRDYGYAFSSWTASWLSKHLAAEFGIQISGRHINRLLKQMGISTKQKGDGE